MRPDWIIIFRMSYLFGISKTHPEDLKRGKKLHYGFVTFKYDRERKTWYANEIKRWII